MNNKKKESITLELTKEEYSKLNEYCKIKNVDYSKAISDIVNDYHKTLAEEKWKIGYWKKYMKNI